MAMTPRIPSCASGLLIVAFSTLLVGGQASAAQPWEVINFKHVEADPSKSYELTEKNGPWLIMVATFAGDIPVDNPHSAFNSQSPAPKRTTVSDAEQDAHDLVLDLRKNFKLNAYFCAKTFDFSKQEQ